MLKEFKAFIMKGNVLELAVAVIIAGAFGAIVKSFTNDVIMPPIGLAKASSMVPLAQARSARQRLKHRAS